MLIAQTKPAKRASGLRRLGLAIGSKAKRARKTVAKRARKAKNISLAFLKGFFVDGPRDTVRAIKKHPVRFTLALGAFVGAAMLLDAFGIGIPLHIAGHSMSIGAHEALVAASATFAGIEMVPHVKAAKKSRGVARARHIGRALWAPALVVGSAAAGGAIGHSASADAAPAAPASLFSGLRAALTRASGHLVTTADAPTILVTANEGH